MANFNKVILVGNLTRDPVLSYLPNKTAVVELGIAVNRRWRSADGQQREETCFIDCRAFGRPAETINQYCAKGRPILLEGHLQYQQWTAQDGGKRSKHVIVVEGFQFMDTKPGAARDNASPPPARASEPQEQEYAASSPPESEQPPAPVDGDVPF